MAIGPGEFDNACMHAYNYGMRTTVEIPNELRLRLIEESARLGERGYSEVVVRALREYFAGQNGSGNISERVDELFGSEPDADSSMTRQTWRTG